MVNGVLLDIAGVVSTGSDPLPGAVQAVQRLCRHLPVRFLTNSTRTPKRLLLERLRGFGLSVEPGDVFTPAEAARAWLIAHDHRPHLLVHPDLKEDFADCASKGPEAVVIGDAGEAFTYAALNNAFRALANGAPFLALAANRVFRDADGQLSLDAGPFVAALEYASGREARLFGKPAREFFAAAARSMNLSLCDVAMVGDDAEADVAGALAAGAGAGILVRTGKYREGDEDRASPPPSAIVADIAEAVELILVKLSN